jgi:Flp pilus assembly protein TadD
MHVHTALGSIALLRNQPRLAAEEFKQELFAFPRADATRRRLAETLMALGEWDEAAAEFAYLLEHTPDDKDLLRGRAQAVFNAGDFELAATFLAPAIALAPEDPYVLLLHANLLEKQGNAAEAAHVYLRAKRAYHPP